MVAVLGPFGALPCYIHTYIHTTASGMAQPYGSINPSFFPQSFLFYFLPYIPCHLDVFLELAKPLVLGRQKSPLNFLRILVPSIVFTRSNNVNRVSSNSVNKYWIPNSSLKFGFLIISISSQRFSNSDTHYLESAFFLSLSLSLLVRFHVLVLHVSIYYCVYADKRGVVK
jgi:hypothetical protein